MTDTNTWRQVSGSGYAVYCATPWCRHEMCLFVTDAAGFRDIWAGFVLYPDICNRCLGHAQGRY